MGHGSSKSIMLLTMEDRGSSPSSMSRKGSSRATVVLSGREEMLVMVSSLYCLIRTSSGCWSLRDKDKITYEYYSAQHHTSMTYQTLSW